MNDFDKIIWRETLTLVEFFATWSGPSLALDPVINRFRREMNHRADVYSIDVDDEQLRDVVRRHRITRIPALIFFRRGEMLGRHDGPLTYDRLTKMLDEIERTEGIREPAELSQVQISSCQESSSRR